MRFLEKARGRINDAVLGLSVTLATPIDRNYSKAIYSFRCNLAFLLDYKHKDSTSAEARALLCLFNQIIWENWAKYCVIVYIIDKRVHGA